MKMKRKVLAVLACIAFVATIIPLAAVGGRQTASVDNTTAGPNIDFLFGPAALGWSATIWNYGTQPAFLIHWKIETKGINGTKVINGNKQGIIPCLRSMHSVYMTPLTLPKTKNIFPFGRGEVEITVQVSCKNAQYSNTVTSIWMIHNGKLVPLQPLS